ncbi:hypothetical protein ACS0TY_004022 [Phlomoides rotata]
MSSSSRMIVLKSMDGEEFEVDEAVALQSQTIKHMIENDCADNITVPRVTANILAKMIEYCKRHVDDGNASAVDLKSFDDDFVKVDRVKNLIDLILAANYLDIKGLVDLTCEAVENMMTGKTPEEIREMFNINNDLTPEAAIREENTSSSSAISAYSSLLFNC